MHTRFSISHFQNHVLSCALQSHLGGSTWLCGQVVVDLRNKLELTGTTTTTKNGQSRQKQMLYINVQCVLELYLQNASHDHKSVPSGVIKRKVH